MSAKPTNKTTHPPSEAVWWLCTVHGGRCIHVKARLWIDARKEAAKQAGCSPDSILCVQDSTEELEDRLDRADRWAAVQSKSREVDGEKKRLRLKAWQSGQAAR